MEKRKIESVRHLPLMPLTVGDMTWNKTGTWRLLTPTVQEKTAPCRVACPIGQPIPAFIRAISDRDWNRALELLLQVNPLPGVTGRLCYHPCQSRCVRKGLDRPVSVRDLEKLVADLGTTSKVAGTRPTGRKVAVCGAGPAGLTAAYHLALRGCQVTVFDPSDQAGGLLKDAKPETLPPDVLALEIGRLAAVSGVLLRMKAVSLNSEEFDLTIVDRSAYQPNTESARAVRALVSGAGPRLDIEVRKGALGLIPVQVAHAVARGRQIASEACQHLGLDADDTNETQGTVATREDIKFHLMPDWVLAEPPAQEESTAEDRAVLEAKRCLSCGTCNLCQSCVLSCPDSCCELDEREGKIVIDLYHCKGCGICVYECPRSVMAMEDLG